MASTVVELLRRRFGGKKGGPNVKKGTITLDASATSISITHNLGSENYIFILRRSTPIIRQDVCNAAFLMGLSVPLKYNNRQSSATTALVCNTFESRTGADYYVGAPTISDILSSFLPNSVVVKCRNGAYPFLAGDHEWIAIDLDSTADAEGTVSRDSQLQVEEITDNLGTTQKIGLLYKDTPTYGVAGWNTSFASSDFFYGAMNSSAYFLAGQEARVAWADYTQNLNTTSTSLMATSNTTKFGSRGGNYLFAGDYHYKIFKI